MRNFLHVLAFISCCFCFVSSCADNPRYSEVYDQKNAVWAELGSDGFEVSFNNGGIIFCKGEKTTCYAEVVYKSKPTENSQASSFAPYYFGYGHEDRTLTVLPGALVKAKIQH